MEISDIGSTYDTALNCNTNNREQYSGDWFAPDGTRVDETEGFDSDINYMVVRLMRTTGAPPEGIYHCLLDDNDECTTKTVYVGLYSSGGGNLDSISPQTYDTHSVSSFLSFYIAPST